MGFKERRWVIIFIFISVGFIFIVRLFFLQVLTDKWAIKAAGITEKKITTYPARGLIYDRFDRLMVANKAIYDLLVVPSEVKNDMDVSVFCNLLEITTEQFEKKLNAAKEYSYYKPSILVGQISSEDFGKIADQLVYYPGFIASPRTLRDYPLPISSHTFLKSIKPTPQPHSSFPKYGQSACIGLRMANTSGMLLPGKWWSQIMTSTPAQVAISSSARAVIPQSSVISKSVFCAIAWSIPCKLTPYPSAYLSGI